ncbi:CPCC family cysteine-rich protein [Cytophaga aurantiaca]|uniref:CPCC family cysteine-rich protein n=1 Tax=Cytophaga aurantiaca TaxID=29530 RepID=UPI00037AB4BE|nr:CPCC family cysteine-rich protein [Cytophaga aurantiaca]
MNNPSAEKIKDILDFFRKRRTAFDDYISQNGLQRRITTCPSCGIPTLYPPAIHEICDLCNWQNDGQDDPDADKSYGGPNTESLTDSRINFGLVLDENGVNMNASIIQKPEILLAILKEYDQKLNDSAIDAFNENSIDNTNNPYVIMKNKLIEEIFKNQ